MKIVVYEARHFDGVDQLWKACFPSSAPRNQAKVAIPQKLASGDDLLMVCEDADGEVVGSIMAGYDGHRGWLYAVATAPERQGEGIGTALVECACERLRELGCTKVNLQIVEGNGAVEAFYRKLGFTAEPRISMSREL